MYEGRNKRDEWCPPAVAGVPLWIPRRDQMAVAVCDSTSWGKLFESTRLSRPGANNGRRLI